MRRYSDMVRVLNRVKSSIRACVEYVFGCMSMPMEGMLLDSPRGKSNGKYCQLDFC
jgi:hypothetical protein